MVFALKPKQPITIRYSKSAILNAICGLLFLAAIGRAGPMIAENTSSGPIFDRFQLTLEAGQRTEAAGPFYYSQQTEDATTWALPPFFSCNRKPGVGARENDFLYPVLTQVHYGQESRWQLFQLLSFSGGQEPSGATKDRVTVFPFYFRQRSPDPNLNYTAVFPFYGRIKDRLFRDEIYFVMFPAYSETRKKDVVTDNYFYPFVHVRHGDGLSGWQVWPIVGREHKEVTTLTNGFGDVTVVGGHDQSFAVWPFWLRQDNGLGTTNRARFRASLPFYAISRSPQRDVTSVLWPLFAVIDDRAKKYHEWQGPWPLVIFTRGEGKTTDRVWPLFSQSHNATQERDSYLWPVWQFRHTHDAPLDQQRVRVMFYLYSRLAETNTVTGAGKVRLDLWPFLTWHHDFNGNEWLQLLAPIEPIVPDNRGIERNWSPLWSLWRAEDNAKTGAASRSLLWNLYRRETAPAHKKVSLLFGLFQYQLDDGTSRTRLFYLPVSPAARGS
jgi:hypothetical protein